jgi:hypothetical protein
VIRRRQARPVGRKSSVVRFRCQAQKRAWKSALEEYCKQFLELIEADTAEEKIQKFLQSHPIFFLPFLPEMLMFKTAVLTRYRVDFALLNERGLLVLIELERPRLHLLKKDGGITAELQHALDQVRGWLQVFANHKGAALDAFNLKLYDVAKVKGIVIAGRSPQDKDQAMRLRCMSWVDIDLYTFDDLLHAVTEMIKRLTNV